MMSDIADSHASIESELARLDPASMHAVGAHYAEIRVAKHSIAVSTMDDAERVREYVEGHTPLRFSQCRPEGRGHVVSFTV